MLCFLHYSLCVCQNYYTTPFIVKALNTVKLYLNVSSYCFHIKEKGAICSPHPRIPSVTEHVGSTVLFTDLNQHFKVPHIIRS